MYAAVSVALFVLGCAGFALGLWLTPFPKELRRVPLASTEFLDRSGLPLRAMLVDERRYARSCTLDEISPFLRDATISAEDRRFLSHHGVDLLAVTRAGWNRLAHREANSGASTITQQLVKIARPGRRSFGQKLGEAWLALRVERTWSKQRILAEYLNRLDYGDLQIGISRASEHFFGKPPLDLSPAEAALLAGLPKAPTRLNPHGNSAGAEQRRRWVLGRMLATHVLAPAAYQRAVAEPLHLLPPGRNYVAPQFVDLLLSHQASGIASGAVQTTLDLALNQFAEQALLTNLARLREKNASSGAVVVLDNRSGEVLAIACASSEIAGAAADVNTAWMVRSPGSAMKPFTYLLALERGAQPGTVVADVPTDFATETGSYRPNNYNHRFYGPVSLRFALGNSLNVAAIRTLELAGGPERLRQAMCLCGITTLDHPSDFYGLGLTLGNGEVRLLELTNAFATLARLGEYRPFTLLSGATEAQAAAGGRRVFNADSAFLLADMLNDNAARATSFGLDSYLRFDFPVACKTGTSSDYRDNWCMGYTPEFTVGVWVGNADGQPMRGITGVTGAAPILHEVFEHLHATRGTSWYQTPRSVRSYTIEPLTGHGTADDALVPSADAPVVHAAGVVWEKSLRPPPVASPTDYDAQGRVVLPPVFGEWLRSSQNNLGDLVACTSVATAPAREAASWDVLAPSKGSVFFLDPDLPRASQTIALRASSSQPLEWSCPTLRIQVSPSGPRAELAEGRHLLRARDPATRAVATTWIEVHAL